MDVDGREIDEEDKVKYDGRAEQSPLKFWLVLDGLDDEGATFKTPQSLQIMPTTSLTFPRSEWEVIGRPGQIVVTLVEDHGIRRA